MSPSWPYQCGWPLTYTEAYFHHYEAEFAHLYICPLLSICFGSLLAPSPIPFNPTRQHNFFSFLSIVIKKEKKFLLILPPPLSLNKKLNDVIWIRKCFLSAFVQSLYCLNTKRRLIYDPDKLNHVFCFRWFLQSRQKKRDAFIFTSFIKKSHFPPNKRQTWMKKKRK